MVTPNKTLKQHLRIIGRRLLGGRPMSFIQMSHRDLVTNKMVNIYCDVDGTLWLATTRWGWDRVRRERAHPQQFR